MGSDELVSSLREDYERAKRELAAIKEDVRHSGPRHIEYALDQLWHNFTALTAQLAEARESERAAVVAFIREQASNADARLGECTKELSAQHFAAASVTCSRLATAIEAGEHLK